MTWVTVTSYTGMPAEEITIAELLQERGYAVWIFPQA